MKTIFIKLLMAGICVALAGCAGMPDMKNLSAAGLKQLAQGGASSPSILESGMAAASSFQESMREIPEDEEIAKGEALMSVILGAAPLHANDRIQRYVNQVGRWIASHSERPGLPWRFAVLESPLANAGAAPGGQIYITTGLLFRMRSEAELAGALAHEIAHVVQKHHIKAYQKAKLGEFAMSAGSVIVDSKVKGGSLGREVGKQAIKLGIGEARTMLLLGLGRNEEEQADRMGMVLAARAGYDPFGLPTVIQILQDLSAEQGGLSLLYATHPAPSERLAALEKTMARDMENYPGPTASPDRFAATILGSAPPSEKKQAAPEKTPTKAVAKPVVKAPPKQAQ